MFLSVFVCLVLCPHLLIEQNYVFFIFAAIIIHHFYPFFLLGRMVIVQNADSIPKGLISLFTAPLKHLMGNDKTHTLNFFANEFVQFFLTMLKLYQRLRVSHCCLLRNNIK